MKKVNFYTVDLYESTTCQAVSYLDLKNYLVEIIEKNHTKHKDFHIVDLTLQDQDLHYIADIYDYEDNNLILRISCQKPAGSYLHRNYSNNRPEALLQGKSENDEGIELYTYALLDYNTGILAIVNQKGAPSYKVLNQLFYKYNVNYYMNFIPIPNANGIDRIYNAKNTQISQVEIEVPVPSADLLQKAFGWKEADILDVQGNNLKVTMKLSSMERRVLTDEEEKSKSLIDCIKSGIHEYQYNKAKIRAKSEGKKMQEYNFFKEYFIYPVEIPTYSIVSGQKHYYTADELIPIYRDNLIMPYNENRELLKSLSDR